MFVANIDIISKKIHRLKKIIHLLTIYSIPYAVGSFVLKLYMKSLGEKIRYYRNLRNWTQNDLADKLDMSLPAYSKMERDVTDVTYSRLQQVAKVFGITVAELVDFSDKSYNDDSDLKRDLAEKEKEINLLQKKIITLLEKNKP